MDADAQRMASEDQMRTASVAKYAFNAHRSAKVPLRRPLRDMRSAACKAQMYDRLIFRPPCAMCHVGAIIGSMRVLGGTLFCPRQCLIAAATPQRSGPHEPPYAHACARVGAKGSLPGVCPWCGRYDAVESLPTVSVVICFAEEMWSSLFRTVYVAHVARRSLRGLLPPVLRAWCAHVACSLLPGSGVYVLLRRHHTTFLQPLPYAPMDPPGMHVPRDARDARTHALGPLHASHAGLAQVVGD